MLPNPLPPKQIQILVYLNNEKELSKSTSTGIVFYPFLYRHLRQLQDKGLIKKSFNENGLHVIYTLTEFGKTLADSLDRLCGEQLKKEGWI